MNPDEFLDPTGREYDLTHPGLAHQGSSPQFMPGKSPKTRLYGGIAARYWLGSPGYSDLIAGIAYLYEPIRVADQESVRQELQDAFYQRIVTAVHESTGLEISLEDLERTQFLEVWRADPDLVERCKAFEQGWSALRVQGKGVRDLTGADIAQLFRRTGAKREG